MTVQHNKIIRLGFIALLMWNFIFTTLAQSQDARALELGKPIERELAGEQAHIYLIELTANDFLHVIVEQRGVDVVVTLFSPDGKKLKEVDSPNGAQGPEPAVLIAETAGTYRVEVRSLDKSAAGKYTVTLTEKRSATYQDREQLTKQAALDEAKELGTQVSSLYQSGRYKDAMPLAQRALTILEKVLGPEHQDVAAALNDLAVLYKATGDLARAAPLLQRALSIFEKVLGPDHPDVASSLGELGLLHQATGDFARAAPLLKRALSIREKVQGPEHPDVARSLSDLASLNLALGNYDVAAPLLKRALSINEKALGPEHPVVATSLNNLALFYQVIGDYARAEPLFRRSLAIREKVLRPDHPGVATALNNLAGLYSDEGDYTRAAPYYQRSLAAFEKALGPDHPNVATALNNLAALYRDKGDYARAAPLYERSLAIREKAFGPEHPEVAHSLNNLAVLYQDIHDNARAEPLFQRSLAVFEKSLGPEHPLVAAVLNSLAGLYSSAGDYTRAAQLFQRSLAIHEKVFGPEHHLVALSLSNLAGLYRDTGDYARSLQLFQRSLAINEKALGPEHPTVALSLNYLASMYNATGDYDRAVSYQQRANDAREKSIASILDTGSQQQKQLYLNTLAGETYRTVSLHAQDAPQNADAGRLAVTTILRRKGRALDAFTGQLEALRRRASPDDKKLLDDLAAVQSQLANLQLGGGKLKPDARRSEVARLIAEQERLEDEIGRHSSEFRSKSQPVTLERVQAALPADATLVELFVYRPANAKAKGTEKRFGAARYVAYVVRAKDAAPQFVDLGDAATVDADAARFRAALKSAKTPIAQIKKEARSLDERVMRPIRKLLGGTKRVFLAPDGALNLVPFGALLDEHGKYLVENYDFNYLTSGRDLLRLQVAGESQEAPAIVANPLFDMKGSAATESDGMRAIGLLGAGEISTTESRGTDFTSLYYPPLVGTMEEASSIGVLFPKARVWTQGDATEAALKTVNRPGILHIATHGFFLGDQAQTAPADGRVVVQTSDTPTVSQQENPMLRSGLILAGVKQKQSGTDEDGVLTAQEAAGLNLFGTKLVVLSACETGLGDVQNGAGVYGLRRALVLAGSETQVMSLWRVSDTATRDLMIAYYMRLQSGEGRIAAMRQVQLAMLRGKKLAKKTPSTGLATDSITPKPEWRHPFYWAAFIPSGAWTNLDGK